MMGFAARYPSYELAQPGYPVGWVARYSPLCANAPGFSLHAAVRCGADRHKSLEHLCRTITRPAIANERLKRNRAGQVVLQWKSAYQDGTTHIVPVKGTMSCRRWSSCNASPRSFPRPRLHPILFS